MKQEFINDIEHYTGLAKGIAFDTCHKIYILLDDEQMALMKEYGYEALISADQMSGRMMAAQVMEWYEDSCSLRFVSAVETKPDPNDGFITVIGQFADEEEDMCTSCGSDTEYAVGLCYECYENGDQEQYEEEREEDDDE